MLMRQNVNSDVSMYPPVVKQSAEKNKVVIVTETITMTLMMTTMTMVMVWVMTTTTMTMISSLYAISGEKWCGYSLYHSFKIKNRRRFYSFVTLPE